MTNKDVQRGIIAGKIELTPAVMICIAETFEGCKGPWWDVWEGIEMDKRQWDEWAGLATPQWLDLMAEAIIDPPRFGAYFESEYFCAFFTSVAQRFPERAKEVLRLLFDDPKTTKNAKFMLWMAPFVESAEQAIAYFELDTPDYEG